MYFYGFCNGEVVFFSLDLKCLVLLKNFKCFEKNFNVIFALEMLSKRDRFLNTFY